MFMGIISCTTDNLDSIAIKRTHQTHHSCKVLLWLSTELWYCDILWLSDKNRILPENPAVSHPHRIHGAGIYANIGGILMGSMLPSIAAPWILWDPIPVSACIFRAPTVQPSGEHLFPNAAEAQLRPMLLRGVTLWSKVDVHLNCSF